MSRLNPSSQSGDGSHDRSRPSVITIPASPEALSDCLGLETVVLPASTVTKLSPEQLAIVIARRLEAIQSGSRTRGLLLALAWVIVGFALSTLLPGAGVTSVAGLTMTCLGFTLWTFFGIAHLADTQPPGIVRD